MKVDEEKTYSLCSYSKRQGILNIKIITKDWTMLELEKVLKSLKNNPLTHAKMQYGQHLHLHHWLDG